MAFFAHSIEFDLPCVGLSLSNGVLEPKTLNYR